MIYNDTNNCEVRFPRNNSISGDMEMQWYLDDYAEEQLGEGAAHEEHLDYVGEAIELYVPIFNHFTEDWYDTDVMEIGSYGLGDDDLEGLTIRNLGDEDPEYRIGMGEDLPLHQSQVYNGTWSGMGTATMAAMLRSL